MISKSMKYNSDELLIAGSQGSTPGIWKQFTPKLSAAEYTMLKYLLYYEENVHVKNVKNVCTYNNFSLEIPS